MYGRVAGDMSASVWWRHGFRLSEVDLGAVVLEVEETVEDDTEVEAGTGVAVDGDKCADAE